MCIYVYTYMCIYVYTYMCIYVYTYMCIYVYAYMCIYVYTYMCILWKAIVDKNPLFSYIYRYINMCLVRVSVCPHSSL